MEDIHLELLSSSEAFFVCGSLQLSAILENKFSLPTTSWWMAENPESGVAASSVELQGDLTSDVVARAEEECNEAIRSAHPVAVRMYELGDPKLDEAHTRGLPEDFSGPVRVVEIGEGGAVDTNMCCGTHVSSLAHLQAVKLLNWERSKKGGRVNLFFLVGWRVIKYLERCFKREQVGSKHHSASLEVN